MQVQYQAWSQSRRMSDPEMIPSNSLFQFCFYILHSILFVSPSHPHPFTFQYVCLAYGQHGHLHRPFFTSHFNFGIHHWLKSLCHFVQILERNHLIDLCSVSRLAHFFYQNSISNQLIRERNRDGDESPDKCGYHFQEPRERHGYGFQQAKKHVQYRAGQEFAFYFHHILDDVLYSRNCHHFCLIICQKLLFCLIALRHLHRSLLSKSNKIINIVTVDFVGFQ